MPHSSSRSIVVQVLGFVCLVLVIGGGLYEFVFKYQYVRIVRERGEPGHDWLQRGFSVATVWPPHASPSLVEGVKMALDEINAGGGPLAGKIHLRTYVEQADGSAQAREVAKQSDVLAVIGHELPEAALPASLTYEQHGILFLAAKSTDDRLTSHNFRYVFRLTFDDRVFSKALARFAHDSGWLRVGVLYGRTDHGATASEEFLTAAKDDGISVPFEYSFFHEPDWTRQDFRPMVADVRNQQTDALMLADEIPWAGKLLEDIARMGVTEPILATNKLDSPQIWAVAQKAANRLYVAGTVDSDSGAPDYKRFHDQYQARFHSEPSDGASHGYEALMMFANAVLKSGTADPLVVATTLRTNSWNGLFGKVSFDESGEMSGQSISIKQMIDGTFHTAAVYKEPKE